MSKKIHHRDHILFNIYLLNDAKCSIIFELTFDYLNKKGNFQQQARQIQITLPLAMPINNATSTGSSTSSATAHGHVSTNGESWRPSEINEYEEMERVHSLKQRESLLKTMGIGDIVNRILSGTSGTVATLPPAFYNNNNNNSNNNNAPQQGANLNQMAPNDVNDFTVNGLLAKNTSQISKLELRTKNFNPFIENNNHSLFAEVIKLNKNTVFFVTLTFLFNKNQLDWLN